MPSVPRLASGAARASHPNFLLRAPGVSCSCQFPSAKPVHGPAAPSPLAKPNAIELERTTDRSAGVHRLLRDSSLLAQREYASIEPAVKARATSWHVRA